MQEHDDENPRERRLLGGSDARRVAWLRNQGRPVTPDSIHDELDRSGLLDSVKQRRSKTEIMKSIRRWCRDPGLFPEGDPRLRQPSGRGLIRLSREFGR